MRTLILLLFVGLGCQIALGQTLIQMAGYGAPTTPCVSASYLDLNTGTLYTCIAGNYVEAFTLVPATRTVNGLPLSANLTITTMAGNAGTATALQTPRTINGVSFNGTSNISIPLTLSSPSGAIGFTTGAGGTVTQLTSKTTGVTINTVTGAITTHNAALAAAAEVSFTVTNSQVGANDIPVVAIKSGGTAGAYFVSVGSVSAGSFTVTLGNVSAGSLSQAVVLSFVVIKGATN